MSSDYKGELTPGQKGILDGIPSVPQQTFAAMAMQQNALTEPPGRRPVKRMGMAKTGPPTCMGCRKPLVPAMVVAYWDPDARELVCNECASSGKVIILGPPQRNVQVMSNAAGEPPAAGE